LEYFLKNSDINVSKLDELASEIKMLLSKTPDETKTMKEIQDTLSKKGYNPDTIMRRTQKITELGWIEHRSKKNGNLAKGYYIPEIPEPKGIQKNNMWITDYDKNDNIINQEYMTQSGLSILITGERKIYQTYLYKRKYRKKSEDRLYWHMVMISHCLNRINMLTWTINSELLGTSERKNELAQNNLQKYNDFLHTIFLNLKDEYPNTINDISQSIYELIQYNEPIGEKPKTL